MGAVALLMVQFCLYIVVLFTCQCNCLQEYKNKLDRVAVVRKELKAHIQSLPDLTMLPDVTGGLAPLPSAGDLFTGAKEPVS